MPTRFLQLGVRKLGNIITYYGVKKRLYAAGGLQRESALRMQANRRFAKRTLVLRGNGLRMQAKARFAPCGSPFGGFMLALGNRDQVLYRGGARLGVSENRPYVAKRRFACIRRPFLRKTCAVARKRPCRCRLQTAGTKLDSAAMQSGAVVPKGKAPASGRLHKPHPWSRMNPPRKVGARSWLPGFRINGYESPFHPLS